MPGCLLLLDDAAFLSLFCELFLFPYGLALGACKSPGEHWRIVGDVCTAGQATGIHVDWRTCKEVFFRWACMWAHFPRLRILSPSSSMDGEWGVKHAAGWIHSLFGEGSDEPMHLCWTTAFTGRACMATRRGRDSRN